MTSDSEPISTEVFIAYNKAVVDNVTSGKREGIIHVSDLIQPKCLRNVYYSKKDPSPRMDYDTAKNFYAGNIVHSHTELSNIPELHEYKIAYNPFTDKIIDLQKALKEHPDPKDEYWCDITIGTIDDVLKMENGEYIIADKKTKLSKPESLLLNKQFDGLKPEHKSQLNMYRLLLLRAKGIDAKYGCILSLDYADKFGTPKALPFDLEKPDVTRANMIQRQSDLKKYLKANKLPPRTIIPWMCSGYCPYWSLCFKDSGVDFK